MAAALKRTGRSAFAPVKPEETNKERRVTRSSSQSGKSICEKVAEIYQQANQSRDCAQILKDAKQGLTLLEAEPAILGGNRDLQHYKGEFHFLFVVAIYRLKQKESLDIALEHAAQARAFAPADKMDSIDFAQAKILALRDRPAMGDAPCDCCAAITQLSNISSASDTMRKRVHLKWAELLQHRISEGHTECFSDSDTQPLDEGEERAPVVLLEGEKHVPDLVARHLGKMQERKGQPKLAKIEADRALRLLSQYSELVARFPLLQERKRLLHFGAARALFDQNKERTETLRHLNESLKLCKSSQQEAEVLLLSASVFEAINNLPQRGKTCSKCKAIELLQQAPDEGVEDMVRQQIHAKLGALYADREESQHSACPSKKRSTSELLVQESYPESQPEGSNLLE